MWYLIKKSLNKKSAGMLVLVFFIRIIQLVFDIIIPLLLTVFNNVVVDMTNYVDNINGPGVIQGYHYSDVLHGGIIYLVITSVIMFGVCILEMTCGLIAQSIASKVAVQMSTDLRFQIYNKLQFLSKADFDFFSTSSLINRLTVDVQILQDCYIYIFRTGLRAIMLYTAGLAGSIAVVCTNNAPGAKIWTIPVLMIMITLGIIAIIATCVTASLKYYKKSKYATDELNVNLRENVLNSKSIRSLNLKEYEIGKFNKSNFKAFVSTKKAYILSMLFIPLLNVIIASLVIVIVWLGTPTKAIVVANVGTLLTLANFILLGLSLMINVILEITIAISSTSRIKEIYNYKTLVPFKEDGLSVSSGNCQLENVDFKYTRSNKMILKNVSLEVKEKQMVGIIGTTGSGKSTILGLLARMYDVNNGKVYLDSVDVKDVKKESIKENFSVCLQEPKILAGSIFDNVKIARPDLTEQEAKEAFNYWINDKFLDAFPNGLDTKIDINSKLLSHTQKQMICLVRSILKDSKVLLIDGVTSELDVQAESNFYKKLKETQKSSVVVCSQRVSAIKDSDIIYVVDEGEIKASGTHEELLVSSSLYRDLNYNQYRGEQ